MQASTIIKDDMTLEQKLEAIDAAMAAAAQPAYVNNKGEVVSVPADRAELLICEGCQ